MVTVIIPVYNSVDTLKKSVDSALVLPHVSEILLIDDSSTDTSFLLIKRLELLHPIVKAYKPFNKNKGVSAMRNFGIQKSCNNYIAFLDADDFYLPNRFNELSLLKNSSVDGIYGTINYSWLKGTPKDSNRLPIINNLPKGTTGLSTKNIPPNQLFNLLLSSKHGWIHLNSLTIKKHVFSSISFNEEFKLAQDTLFFLECTHKFKLISGQSSLPVATRCIHNQNTTLNQKDHLNYKNRVYLIMVNNYNLNLKDFITCVIKLSLNSFNLNKKRLSYPKKLIAIIKILSFIITNPSLFFKLLTKIK